MDPASGDLPPRDGELWRTTRNAPVDCRSCGRRAVDWPVVSWHVGRSAWLLRLRCGACGALDYATVDEGRVAGYRRRLGDWRRD